MTNFIYGPGRIIPFVGRNQSYNVHNSNQQQGTYRRVLAVCSAGILRSATIASVLNKEYNFNVRNCGVNQEYALIPISQALLHWADHIVFADHEHYHEVENYLREAMPTKTYQILELPDCFEYNEAQLRDIIMERFDPKKM